MIRKGDLIRGWDKVGTPIWCSTDIMLCVDFADPHEVMVALSSPDKDGWVLVSSPRGICGRVYKKYIKQICCNNNAKREIF